MKAVISMSAENGGMRYHYAYDGMCRLTEKKASGRTLLSFTYDLNGNLTSQTDVTGKTTEYRYNRVNRLTEVWDHGKKLAGYEYNPEQFKDWFARRGIDVNNVAFYYDLPEGIHRRSDENGIHTNNNPLGRNWNKEWQHYMDTYSNATKLEVFKQLLYMERKTGVSEYRARK